MQLHAVKGRNMQTGKATLDSIMTHLWVPSSTGNTGTGGGKWRRGGGRGGARHAPEGGGGGAGLRLLEVGEGRWEGGRQRHWVWFGIQGEGLANHHPVEEEEGVGSLTEMRRVDWLKAVKELFQKATVTHTWNWHFPHIHFYFMCTKEQKNIHVLWQSKTASCLCKEFNLIKLGLTCALHSGPSKFSTRRWLSVAYCRISMTAASDFVPIIYQICWVLNILSSYQQNK